MIEYQQEKEMALKVNKKVKACREFKDAYHFYDKNNQEEMIPDEDIIIFKDNGKIVNLTTFILGYQPEKNPREIEF